MCTLFHIQPVCQSGCVCEHPSSWKTEELALNCLQEVLVCNLRGTKHEAALNKPCSKCWCLLTLYCLVLSDTRFVLFPQVCGLWYVWFYCLLDISVFNELNTLTYFECGIFDHTSSQLLSKSWHILWNSYFIYRSLLHHGLFEVIHTSWCPHLLEKCILYLNK